MSKLRMILIDAGHGGIIGGQYQTAGKRSPIWGDGSQYFEGVGNRLIREELAKLLRLEGIQYKFVNLGEKDMSLRQRKDIINAYARKYGVSKTLGISIHSNGFHKESAKGWSCFTSIGDTNSDDYAEQLYKEIEVLFPDSKMRVDFSDGDIDKERNFYLLKETICSMILSENFFMTNEKECRDILMTKKGRRKIALAHFNMIKKFL